MSATGESRDSGMTLLEVLVVTAVTVLVSGLIFPNLQRGLGRLSAAQAELGVAADIRQARAAAQRSGRTVALAIAADGLSYGGGGLRRELPAGTRLAPAGAVLRLQPDGSTSGATWRLEGERWRSGIRVDAATGAVFRP